LDFLRACPDTSVTLTFEEIEALLGQPLPYSARRYATWWYRSELKPPPWQRIGRKVSCSLAMKIVTFTRVP
jgi:hypothetical protein